MNLRRNAPDQIAHQLIKPDRIKGERRPIMELCQRLEAAEQAYHRWSNHNGRMMFDSAKRLEEREKEITLPQQIVANQALDIDVFKDLHQGNI